MNSIDDIAKMAIQEVGAELEQMSVRQNSPKPLKSAKPENSALNQRENSPLENSASVIKAENLEQNLTDDFVSNDFVSNDTENLENSKNLELSENSSNELNFLKNSQESIEIKNSNLANAASSDEERQFLSNLKERIEVLFAGLKANDDDKTLRLELTIRFLEFLLAKTNERLSDLQK